VADKGRPESWGEPKQRVNMSLTPTAIKQLDELAQQRDLSRSELVERIGRGIITLNG
jgi:metal-responsive CopG/Arc/MetJ family transcriptional regulator